MPCLLAHADTTRAYIRGATLTWLLARPAAVGFVLHHGHTDTTRAHICGSVRTAVACLYILDIVPEIRYEFETISAGHLWFARRSGLPHLLLGPLSQAGPLPLGTSPWLYHINVGEVLTPVIIQTNVGPIPKIKQVHSSIVTGGAQSRPLGQTRNRYPEKNHCRDIVDIRRDIVAMVEHRRLYFTQYSAYPVRTILIVEPWEGVSHITGVLPRVAGKGSKTRRFCRRWPSLSSVPQAVPPENVIGASRCVWIARNGGLPRVVLGPLSHWGTLPNVLSHQYAYLRDYLGRTQPVTHATRTTTLIDGWGRASVQVALATVIVPGPLPVKARINQMR